MADIYVKSGGGTIGSGSYRGNWTASSTYALGDRVCGVATSDYWIFECTTAGTSAGTEPTWVKTAGSTTTDNTVTWTARIPSTWENATFTLAKASANDAAGDNIYVSQAHAESSATAQIIALAGTAANPNRVLCVNDGASPPTTVATTATVSTTLANAITLQGCGYYYGVVFNAGSGNNQTGLFFGASADNVINTFEQCSFVLTTTNNLARISFSTNGYGLETFTTFKNCYLKFSNANQGIQVYNETILFSGGSILSGGTSLTTLIINSADTIQVKFVDFDFSNFSSSFNFVYSAIPATGRVDIINCKLPASWSGGVVAGAPANPGLRVSMYNCDSGATNYRLWIETYSGSIKSETTIVKSGGATDGTTALSWKLASTANANEYVAPLITDDMAIWIDTTGASKTITVDLLHDSTTALTDAEVWLEIDYLGSSATPLGTPASDKRATVLTTPTNQTTSTATWTTTGMTNPNKQKLEVTFTPNMKGFVYARVNLAKASYTIYVDPEPVLA